MKFPSWGQQAGFVFFLPKRAFLAPYPSWNKPLSMDRRIFLHCSFWCRCLLESGDRRWAGFSFPATVWEGQVSFQPYLPSISAVLNQVWSCGGLSTAVPVLCLDPLRGCSCRKSCVPELDKRVVTKSLPSKFLGMYFPCTKIFTKGMFICQFRAEENKLRWNYKRTVWRGGRAKGDALKSITHTPLPSAVS